MPDTEEIQKVNETLYHQNLELAVKNKTLALLEKLYQKSITVLMPKEMAEDIIKTIREDLKLEFTGIFTFNKELDSLIPLAFSKADRLLNTMHKLGFMFLDIKIADIQKRPFLKKVVYEQTSGITNNLGDIWENLIKPEHLEEIKKESHIKTILLYPLLTGKDVMGVLILGLNRDYETLSDFEKLSITSFTNVIALSLSKAYLYQDLQEANIRLEALIKQRESLMHLVTHKVKGSFTHSKYIFAEILAGSFGQITDDIKKIAEKGLESVNTGIETVDIVLNAANLSTGKVKYDMLPLDFKDLVQKTVSEKKGPAETRGLKLETNIKEGNYSMLGDALWLKEVVNNLVENSIRYTRAGTITVGLERKNDKILFSVKDTGVGITEEDRKNLFTEGGRGKDSVKVNIESTGYGLFTVKMVVEAHLGRVWVESEGAGKGSTFFVELPTI
jgi:signal transduction histidine kinase